MKHASQHALGGEDEEEPTPSPAVSSADFDAAADSALEVVAPPEASGTEQAASSAVEPRDGAALDGEAAGEPPLSAPSGGADDGSELSAPAAGLAGPVESGTTATGDGTVPSGPPRRDVNAYGPLRDVLVVGDAGRQGEIVPVHGELSVDVADTELDFCTVDPFEVRACATRGASHRHAGTPRQDAFCLATSDEWLVMAVADGVSAGPHSAVAARTAARAAVKLVLDAADDLSALDWTTLCNRVSRRIVEEARYRRLVDLSATPDPEQWRVVRRQMSTTAVVAALARRPSEDGTFAIHLAVLAGDSGAYLLDDGCLSSLAGGKDVDTSGIADGSVSPLPGPATPVVLTTALGEGQALVLTSDGVGDPLGDGTGDVGRVLGQRWRTAPSAAQFFSDVNFHRRTFDDDRTAVAAWVLPVLRPAGTAPV